jgi:hypothetical protein
VSVIRPITGLCRRLKHTAMSLQTYMPVPWRPGLGRWKHVWLWQSAIGRNADPIATVSSSCLHFQSRRAASRRGIRRTCHGKSICCALRSVQAATSWKRRSMDVDSRKCVCPWWTGKWHQTTSRQSPMIGGLPRKALAWDSAVAHSTTQRTDPE